MLRTRINWLAMPCSYVNTNASPCPYGLTFAKLNHLDGVAGYENLTKTLCVCTYLLLTIYCPLSKRHDMAQGSYMSPNQRGGPVSFPDQLLGGFVVKIVTGTGFSPTDTLFRKLSYVR
jgi:hypothetical protein